MTLVSSKQVATNSHELVIEVKGEQFTKAVDAAAKKGLKNIALPGFRKGKAPRAMVEKRYGKGIFQEDALNDLYPIVYSEAVKEAGITPVDAAAVEVLEMNEEGFQIKATITVKPLPTLGEYKGLSAEKKVEAVTDAQLEEQINTVREQYARIVEVTDGAAKLGDTAHIDFEGFVDGVAFEGGKGEDYPLTLGSGSFIPGFEEQVVGHKAGESFDVVVTFPAEYGEASLAGKEATFKVTIRTVMEKQLPDIDDEFAKDVSEFETLDAYKADLRSRMEKNAEEKANGAFENALMEQVVANMTVEVPACMIDHRVDELVRDFGTRMQQQGLKLEDFLSYTGETLEKFRETFRLQADAQVKTRLAMEAIAAAEKLVPTEEEIAAEYKRMAEMYHTPEEKVRQIIPTDEVSEDIACNKAIAIVTESAKAVAPAAEEKAEEAEAAPVKKPRKPRAKKEAAEAAE